MGLQLIIAEKPSLGRNIVDAINGMGNGQMAKRAGYYEGAGYIVTWAFGHLFSLSDIEYYSDPDFAQKSDKVRWSMDNIPCFPRKFNFSLRMGDDGKPDAGVQNQFNTIKTLCNREDVDTVINAGDADREGEIIVRLCISKAMDDVTRKAQKRLWLPDQTAQTICAALGSMKDASSYELLSYEGYARTFIDWLYGVNLTRYATLKSGTLLRVGRVIVPIVKAVYDRDMQIRNFVPEPYFALVSKEQTKGEEIELQSKTRFTGAIKEGTDKQKVLDELKARAQARCDEMNALEAVVTEVKSKKAKLPRGKLYSLTKLQNVLSKKYKMPMNESLEIAQRLYERGFLTYPRTNSEYLATAEKDKMKQILSGVQRLGYAVKFRDDKSVFDDSKIEAHSALTPTFKIPKKGELTEKENQLYGTVFRRFAAVFCEKECVVNKTEITIALGNDAEVFTLKGTVMLEKGWTEYDESQQKDKILPDLKKGDRVNIRFNPLEKTTTAPKHHTVESLNNYLKNPFREEMAAKRRLDDGEENDEADYRAIFEGLELGTEATRTGIIENALKSEYMALSKDVYTILPKGEYLVQTLELLGISMDKYKTSQLGQALKKVYKGEISIRAALSLAQREIAAVFACSSPVSAEKDIDIGLSGQQVGVCPLCKKTVVRGRYNYGCSGYKEGCGFKIPLSICRRAVPMSAARALLENGTSARLEGFISKSGKPFAASLVLNGEKTEFKF